MTANDKGREPIEVRNAMGELVARLVKISHENETGRANAEASAPPVDGQGASPAAPYPQSTHYPRPMGATPLPDADPQDMGDALALDEVRYIGGWHVWLSRGDT